MSQPENSPRFWAIVPAAGVGRRMGSAIPKQYLTLHGRRVIDHSIAVLLAEPRIERVVVALSPDDPYWPDCDLAADPRITRVSGGAERMHSVLNALQWLATPARPHDWVLVHDAARPCLAATDLTQLMMTLQSTESGGLLGIPVRDTMKLCDERGEVTRTLPRSCIWHAYTPQMFRHGMLLQALQAALDHPEQITDEASAMEATGHRPQMVEGRADNIKITRPGDVELAAFYLRRLSPCSAGL